MAGGGVARPKMRFLGLYDPVGSFGIPGNAVNIRYDLSMPTNIEDEGRVAAAYSQHEVRSTFPSSRFVPKPGVTFVETTFPGVHADAPGGYQDKRQIADVGLLWMWEQARDANVPLRPLPPDVAMSAMEYRAELEHWEYWAWDIHDSRYATDKFKSWFFGLFGKDYKRKVFYK